MTRHPSTSTAIPSALATLTAALLLLAPAARADLSIRSLNLHQYEDGPIIGANYEYLPGETAWLTVRVADYATEEALDEVTGQDRHLRLNWTIAPVDPAGLPIVAPQSGTIDERLRPQDEDWVPKVSVGFLVPAFAPRGTYRIPVEITDELAGTTTTGELEFRVRGETLPSADAFGFRDFGFFAREDDAFSMQPAVYHPSDALLARFQIVGYQFAEGNRFAVDYGIAILGPDGRTMFSQPTAATETQEGFYPQRWVPAGFGVNLDDDIRPGIYTLVVTASDKIGGQSQELRQSFQIR